jgi:urease accessory protein
MLAKLQSWFSPSFPVGSFAYSHGLEWAVETREVSDAASLEAWVAGALRYGAGHSDSILMAEAWRAVRDDDWDTAAAASALGIALQPTRERRLESLAMGSAFLRAVSAGWPHPKITSFQQLCGGDQAYPIAVGVASAAHDVPLDAALVAYVHAFCANLISSGVRLIPLGQTDGLRVMSSLESAVVDIAIKTQELSLHDVGSASFLADIASMRHETQYTRLFRS